MLKIQACMLRKKQHDDVMQNHTKFSLGVQILHTLVIAQNSYIEPLAILGNA